MIAAACADNVVQEGRRRSPGSRPKQRRRTRTSREARHERLIAASLAVAGPGRHAALAAEPQACAIPGYLLFGDNELKRVAEAVAKDRRLTIAVVGTGSSALAGPDGPRSAYPARLEAALKQRLPGIAVKVVTLVRRRMTAEDMAKGMAKLLVDEKPDLVIWQTGTIDAMRRIELDEFQGALDEGGRDVAQGRCGRHFNEHAIQPPHRNHGRLGPYADNMRVVAQQHEVPLFDRLGIMRHWSDDRRLRSLRRRQGQRARPAGPRLHRPRDCFHDHRRRPSQSVELKTGQ